MLLFACSNNVRQRIVALFVTVMAQELHLFLFINSQLVSNEFTYGNELKVETASSATNMSQMTNYSEESDNEGETKRLRLYSNNSAC
ncbi:hypothetical protein V1477_008052 [Vespula maculifrons]|uniref:Uncharacterized protein n=1 Tax=Vespula maculifrons TaxID=7453 RepID=A0ABD2CFV3_VESMC